jgi:potassium-transporting ATPase KdpC subunit
MLANILVALRASAVTLVVTGLLYPGVVTGAAQLLFPGRANGSLAHDGQGHEVGSELIAQPFANPAYLSPRPSAAGDNGYDPTSSSGSNLGPTSAKLRDRVKGDLERLTKENPDAAGPVPVELVTTSASGLDPELSPEAALWQVPRIAKARGVGVQRVAAVINEYVEGRDLVILGEPRVNVLTVNLALDKQLGAPSAPTADGSAARR